jgi:histidinol-phosphate/aromatic aminotransferase/cobyric acid decarboxylase-like protein
MNWKRLGLGAADLDRLLDFSVNVSPYGRLQALDDRHSCGSPGSLTRRCRAVARGGRWPAAWQVPAERVALGNGAAELLFTLVQVLCAGGRTLLTVEPTFSEPAAAVRACGGRLASWRAGEGEASGWTSRRWPRPPGRARRPPSTCATR